MRGDLRPPQAPPKEGGREGGEVNNPYLEWNGGSELYQFIHYHCTKESLNPSLGGIGSRSNFNICKNRNTDVLILLWVEYGLVEGDIDDIDGINISLNPSLGGIWSCSIYQYGKDSKSCWVLILLWVEYGLVDVGRIESGAPAVLILLWVEYGLVVGSNSPRLDKKLTCLNPSLGGIWSCRKGYNNKCKYIYVS